MRSPSVAEAGTTAGHDASTGWTRRSLLFGVGTVLLIVYLQGLDYAELLRSARTFPVELALAVLAVNLLPGAIKYLRWRYFLSQRGLRVDGWRGYLAVNASFFLGLVTPGTAGELSRAWVGESDQAGRATAIVAFEKVTDLVVLVLLVVWSAAAHFADGVLSWTWVAGACLATVAGYGLFLRYDSLLTKPAKFLSRRLVSSARRRSLRDAYWDFYELARRGDIVLVSMAVSLALWTICLGQMQLVFVGLGWELPITTAALMLFLPYLVAVISLIPMGIGAFELSMAQVVRIGTVGGAGGAAGALAPLFFRFLVTLPLVVGGYVCHLVLVIRRGRRRE